MSTIVGEEATRRRLSPRRAVTVDRLAAAVLDELGEAGYAALTVRSVARRAGVAPATAYTYFTSKAHMVAEVFWRRLAALPEPPPAPGAPAADRVALVLESVAAFVAAEPRLADACAPALLGDDPDVAVLRDRIGAELHRRLRHALGSDPSAEALATALDLMLAGALVRAGMGHLPYDQLATRLAALARLVVGDRP